MRTSPPVRADFEGNDEATARFYRETEELVRAATGADKVFVYLHALRQGVSSEQKAQYPGPVDRVHCDYTGSSGMVKLKILLDEGFIERTPLLERLKRRFTSYLSNDGLSTSGAQPFGFQRFSLVNVWRSVNPDPVLRWPLALCDARSARGARMMKQRMIFVFSRARPTMALPLFRERDSWLRRPLFFLIV